MERKILHCDMNNCYASIEEMRNPYLKGTCMVVGGNANDRQGIVLAKNRRAKQLGIKTGETLYEARMKCPNLIVVEPHYEAYKVVSFKAREIYYSFTNLVESFGLDECFVDISGSMLFGDEIAIAEKIRTKIKKELGITISVGVSYNKCFAKLASDLAGYDETLIIRKEDLMNKVWPLRVDAICGIGRKTATKLHVMNIDTVGELAQENPDFIVKKLGVAGLEIWNWANGRDYRRVTDFKYEEDKDIKSLGRGTTFKEDLVKNDEVKDSLLRLATYVADGLKKYGKVANGIEIAVKNSKLETKIFQKKINFSTDSIFELYWEAYQLFKKRYSWNYGIRAMTIRGIYLENKVEIESFNFFPESEKINKIRMADRVMYDVNQKYKKHLLTYAATMNVDKFPEKLNDVITLPRAFFR